MFEHGKNGVCTGDNWKHQHPAISENPCTDGWPAIVRKVFLAGIVVTAILLAQKTFVQLIAIDYHRKQYSEKILESKRMIRHLDLMYDTSRSLFPEFCQSFREEDAAIHGNTFNSVRQKMAKAGVGTKMFRDLGRVSMP